jgi:hypothetical protein
MGQRLQIDPSYIAAVMAFESGFNPAATNSHSKATGLIQFMPTTARSLGTTVDRLRSMSAAEQLPYVEAFYDYWAGKLKTPGQVYMSTFMPAHTFKPQDYVIAVKGEKVYDWNSGLDIDKDGSLTVGDVTRRIEGMVASARKRPPIEVQEVTSPSPKGMS